MNNVHIALSDRASEWANRAHRLYLEYEGAPHDNGGLIELDPDRLIIPAISPARSMGLTIATILTLHGMTAVVAQVALIDVKAARWIEQQWHNLVLRCGAVWMS